MALTSDCPLGTALTAVPETTCPLDFGQVAKIAFQLSAATPLTTSTILVKANWTSLLSASDGTKMVLTPILSDFKFPKSEILKEGGNDNTTFAGIPMVNGLGHVEVTATMRSISAATKLALQALFDFSQVIPGYTKLWAYFLTADNKVIYKLSSTNALGFPVFGFAVSDMGSEGFAKHNECDLKFFMQGGWSDAATCVATTDIDVLTLVNPT